MFGSLCLEVWLRLFFKVFFYLEMHQNILFFFKIFLILAHQNDLKTQKNILI
jgi:hypothetical protein